MRWVVELPHWFKASLFPEILEIYLTRGEIGEIDANEQPKWFFAAWYLAFSFSAFPVQTLEGDNWAAIAPHGQALQQFFEKPLTYLTIKTVININNKSVHQELVNQLETLKQQHAGHKYPLHISTKQYTEDMFLVATGHTYMSPTFRRTLYWICTYLGLSLVYRLVMYLNTGHEEYKIKKEFQSEENFQPFQINLTAPTRKEIEVKFNGELEEDIIAVDVGQLSDNGDDVGQLPDNGNYVGQLSDNGNDVGQLSDIGNEDCHKEDCQEEVHNQTNSRYEDSEQAGLEKADNEDCGKENSIKLDLEKEIYYNDSKDSFVWYQITGHLSYKQYSPLLFHTSTKRKMICIVTVLP